MAILSSEGCVAFQPIGESRQQVDPFVEWLSLMEVVEMLCPERKPAWPSYAPTTGDSWKN